MDIYQDISKDLEFEFKTFYEFIKKYFFTDKNELSEQIFSYISSSKKIRSSIIFLVLKSLNYEIMPEHYKIACAIELIHNASLLHDDVIDKATSRRNQKSFNEKFGNSLSIIGGDYLLSIVMKLICSIDKTEIYNIFSDTITALCNGEISQHFWKNKLYSIEDYIKKSYLKTGKLFETAIFSSLFLVKQNPFLSDFAKNYGIAYQIRDDYNNIYNGLNSDINDGIYSSSVIFAANDYPNITELPKNKIIEIANRPIYQNMSQDLIKEYTNLAIENLRDMGDNRYKTFLIELCRNLEV